MSDYSDTARGAWEALQTDGALVLVEWTVEADYDPAAPVTAPTSVSISTYGVMVPYNRERVGTQPDSLIRAGDRNLLLAPLLADGVTATPEPPPNASITAANGERWRVAAVEAVCPTDMTVLYDITARR